MRKSQLKTVDDKELSRWAAWFGCRYMDGKADVVKGLPAYGDDSGRLSLAMGAFEAGWILGRQEILKRIVEISLPEETECEIVLNRIEEHDGQTNQTVPHA